MDLERVSPPEARRLVEDKGYVLIDVRSIPEFEEHRAPGAYNIPFLHKTPDGMVPNEDFEKVVRRVIPEPERGIVTHCKMGGRSLRAAQQLRALGYTRVADMRGGFDGQRDDGGAVVEKGWVGHELPTESGPGSERAYGALAVETDGAVAVPESNPPPPIEGDPNNRFASDKRTVQCVKYRQRLPGLKRRPYPGPLGVRLFEQVSALAWNEWVEHSKMIINEYRIVSTDPKAMQMLYEQCESFFFGAGVDRPAEFVAPV